MYIIIYFINAILAYYIFFHSNEKEGFFTRFRESFVKTLIFFALISLILTELLSSFNLITQEFFVLIYTLIFIVLIWWIIFKIKIRGIDLSHFQSFLPHISKPQKWIFILSFVFIIVPLFVILIFCPSNDVDSLGYHLNRIEIWIQNKNIEYYPTYDLRQIYHQPLAEYLILQMRIMSGTDYFSSFVQFFSMIGSVLVSSLIAKKFGLRSNAQILTSVIALTVPMGILQSTSTQTDYVAAFFFLSFIYFGLKYDDESKTIDIIYAALALSLGLLTKATLYVFAFPFVIWFGVSYLLKYRKEFIKVIIITSAIFLSINSIYFIRNFNLTGSIFGDEILQNLMKNDKLNIENTLSNLLRNVGLQIGVPFQPFNSQVDSVIYGIHDVLAIDINNKETTFNTGIPYKTKFSTHEGAAGNYLVIFCSLIALIYFILFKNKFDDHYKKVSFYIICIFFGLLIYSFLFKWQAWAARLLLPLSIAPSCFLAYAICSFFRSTKIINIIMICFIFSASPFVFMNVAKPLLPIRDLVMDYYFGMPSLFFDTEFDNLIKKISEDDKHILLQAYHKKEGSFYYDIKENVPNDIRKSVYVILQKNNALSHLGTIFKSRSELYFNNQLYLYNDYSQTSRIILEKNLKTIGLDMMNWIDYPLWVMTNANENGIRFEYFRYQQYLSKTRNFRPNIRYDAIITNSSDITHITSNREVKETIELDYLKIIILK